VTGSAREVAAALTARQSFLLTSHARPDGDAIGSPLALALALDTLGKSVRVLLRDPAPQPYRCFPCMDRIEITSQVDPSENADAVVLLECSELTRPEIAGLDRFYIINVDHHPGNRMYGAINWFNADAAACGEMVADIIDALGVRWTREMAAHLYLAITTDTGGFRYGPITPKTFEICRRIAETGVEPAVLSRQIFDSFSIGRVKLMGAMLSAMELHLTDRVAVLYFDQDLLDSCGAALDDTEGLVNLPLGAVDVKAVALFKRQAPGVYRASLRSKGDVDVRAIATKWDGGGHKNAAGCTLKGDYEQLKAQVLVEIEKALR
jgi:phosphoesterase RecJ-like protein